MSETMNNIGEKTGSLIFINFDDLIMKFARYNDLADYSILIASHELSGSLKTKGVMSGVSTGISYASKYDNIEFVDSLRPTAQTMEYCYGGDKQRFIEMFNSHLLSVEPFTDLCAVVDMVVNLGEKVLIVMASYEAVAGILDYIRDFILSEFGLHGYMYDELERLITYYNDKPKYEKIVKSLPFGVSDEFDGENIDCIVNNIGNVDEIRERLVLQEQTAAAMAADPGTENDFLSVFFNRFTEDMEDKVKELLMKRSEDDIKDVCRSKGIRIVPGTSKKVLVDKILHELRLDVRRMIEWDSN